MCPDAYKAGLVPYAGPQCFPQLKDPVRLQANSHFCQQEEEEDGQSFCERQQG